MKRILFFLISLFSLSAMAQEPFFQYPTPPESIEGFYPRCNYIVEHFWDRCDMKSAFSSKAKFKNAFNDYVSFTIYAGKDTVYTSIDKLIKAVEKQPKNLLTLGQIAEECLYSDSTSTYSEELYYPFVKAIAQSKKISSAEKARFVHQERILAHTQVGMIVPDFEFTMADDTRSSLAKYKGVRTILMFADPDCDDCRMLFVRLSADFNLKSLLEKNQVALIIITPSEPSDEWKLAVKDFPASWVVGASEDADNVFDLENLPATYYLNAEQKILSKTIDSNRLLEIFRVLNISQNSN